MAIYIFIGIFVFIFTYGYIYGVWLDYKEKKKKLKEYPNLKTETLLLQKENKSLKEDIELLKSKSKRELEKTKNNFDQKITKLKEDIQIITEINKSYISRYNLSAEKSKELNRKLDKIYAKNKKLEKLNKELKELNIGKISSIYSDFKLLEYDLSIENLETKKRPAFTEALRIKDLKQKTKTYIEQYRQMFYKYEYLLNIFPELSYYVDDFQSLKELENTKNINNFKENYDNTKNYINKKEYENLSIDERNQLALDRYIKSHKTNWQIGRDYELFCGIEYEKEGWNVQYFGMEKKFEDLGRDLIAERGNQIHIIQCKYWAKEKTIHEKHILQLYGTTIIKQKEEENKGMLGLFRKEITPVFITNIKLSETAQNFADILKVKVIQKKLEEFPRIKCNIGKDEFGIKTKIYHLPFDQQYDRTRIKKGEGFFAYTVKEAVNQGFRRAYKYYG